jgi:hypothetical protein
MRFPVIAETFRILADQDARASRLRTHDEAAKTARMRELRWARRQAACQTVDPPRQTVDPPRTSTDVWSVHLICLLALCVSVMSILFVLFI